MVLQFIRWLPYFTLKMNKELKNILPQVARMLQNELTLTCPVDTGRLKNSIKVQEYERGIVITMVDYGKFVEYGSPPHVITPKTKKALKFKSGGKDIFAKKVKHPGTRPNPFIRNALQTKLANMIIKALSSNT